MFRDRTAAGVMLAEQLKKYRNDTGVVLAVPRGGVPVAYPVAVKLGFITDLVLTKKIGHPLNKEYAIGAASLTDYFIVPHKDVSAKYIEQEVQQVRLKLKAMQKKFKVDTPAVNITGKTVIIIDDGIATGNTLLATVQLLRKSHPRKIVIGVPVASKTAVQKLTKEVDDLVAVIVPDEFYGVGAFYENFEQVEDGEVIFYLDKLKDLQQKTFKTL